MKNEFKLLKKIIASYAPADYSYQPSTGNKKARRSDYEMINIIPVSDPNAATMSQKVVQYQAVLQLSQTAPQLYNLPYLHRQMLDVLGIKNAEKLVPLPEDEKPLDPITENMNALKNKPMKAFMYQDHQAHIQIHMAMLNDPKIRETMGQNPQAPLIAQALQSHITEHIGMEYKRQMELTMGINIPYNDMDANDESTKLSPEQELQIARMAVPAAQQLLNQNQTEIAARNAQQAAQDPVVQMQLKELQLKAQEVDIKMKKMQIDAAAKADQLEVEKARIAAQKEIAGMQVTAKAQAEKASIASKEKMEGFRLGSDIGKSKAQMAMQEKQQQKQNQQPSNKETK